VELAEEFLTSYQGLVEGRFVERRGAPSPSKHGWGVMEHAGARN
jgi:hypothetical protein